MIVCLASRLFLIQLVSPQPRFGGVVWFATFRLPEAIIIQFVLFPVEFFRNATVNEREVHRVHIRGGICCGFNPSRSKSWLAISMTS